ncbi:uncharacterized protein FOMMEDRAFT_148481 [Fomitiporia mediterranea MF3/22]|uniref:uncharacterized protein n=1 Tax=Fomitiporia mediterranea (strain MF3/22) TaxID=694068 RepID=UPI00044078E5|nr:uncharacterized protein FOMMEDRAFT_148481 [Fomitiporia mediterranea MF3/22]EJD00204.1 hypothetical protein FOMMEDRAFT_148481 [Fomitiporia mediterranea MF3/22]
MDAASWRQHGVTTCLVAHALPCQVSNRCDKTSEIALHLQAEKYYALASYEIEKIWRRRFTGITILWFLFSLLILALAGATKCIEYIRFPGYVLAFQRIVAVTIFILRMYCLYQRDLRAPCIIAFFLAIEFSVKIAALCIWAEEVILPLVLSGCILAVSSENASKYIWIWVTEVFTDLSVLCLTLYRSHVVYGFVGTWMHAPLWTTIVKDGTLYFAIMLVVNMTTVILHLTMPRSQGNKCKFRHNCDQPSGLQAHPEPQGHSVQDSWS